MREFKLDPAAASKQARLLILRTTFMLSLIFSGTLFLMLVAHPDAKRFRESGVVTGSALFALFVVTGAVVTRTALQNARSQWQSFLLVLDEDALSRYVAQLPPLSIRRTEVAKLVEIPGHALVVRSRDQRLPIVVPAALIGYDELRSALGAWAPIETTPPGRAAILGWGQWLGAIAFVLGSFGAVIGAKDLRVVVPAGALVVGVLAWSTRVIRKTPGIDPRIQRNARLVILPAVAVVAIVIFKVAVALGRG